MASTIYKGDLAEVTFGHECGIVIAHGSFGGVTFSISTTGDISTITFASGSSGFFSAGSYLRYPVGMLVGSQLRVIGGANYNLDDYATKGHVYNIVANEGFTIKVSPAMKSSGASATGDELMIDTIATPACDTGMVYATTPLATDESVLTDQFIGLAATIALPETKVEIRRSHVVGIGRDVVIQEPQSMKNEGGSMEMMFNSARWLYYALGAQVVNEPSTVKATCTGHTELPIAAGDTYFAYTGAMVDPPVAGDYLLIVDGTAVDFPNDRAVAAASKKWGDDGLGTDMEEAERNEIRRVIAVDTTITERRIHVDEPFTFDHAIANMTQKVVAFDAASADGSPAFDTTAATYGAITNRQSRLLFEGATVPSFTLESSIRTRNIGSYNANSLDDANLNAPGSISDSKQLTRIWRGCKVKDWSLAADADAEVKLSVNFDALYCYTDTGRLEDTAPADRYTAHRMFENIANSVVNRKIAGIAPNTEKPYFFYDGSITAFGINLAQITNFSLSGNNNIENILTVRGSSLAESRNSLGQSLEQVPFAGSRNPSLTVEKQVEYECKLSLIISDPLLWHEFRTNRSHGYTEPITLTLAKAGAGVNREEVIIVIDDYIISEAPLPIPEDKGPIKSEMTIMPKHVRVISHDALLGL
jgi:hypothetical protein